MRVLTFKESEFWLLVYVGRGFLAEKVWATFCGRALSQRRSGKWAFKGAVGLRRGGGGKRSAAAEAGELGAAFAVRLKPSAKLDSDGRMEMKNMDHYLRRLKQELVRH